MTYLKHEKLCVGGSQAICCHPSQQLYYVIRLEKTALIDLSTKTCSKCNVRNQLVLPCRHATATLNFVNHNTASSLSIMEHVHDSYKISILYNLLLDTSIVISNFSDILPFTTCKVLAPPLYNNVGGTNDQYGNRPVGRKTRKDKKKKKDN
jgi:hypothetical protein